MKIVTSEKVGNWVYRKWDNGLEQLYLWVGDRYGGTAPRNKSGGFYALERNGKRRKRWVIVDRGGKGGVDVCNQPIAVNKRFNTCTEAIDFYLVFLKLHYTFDEWRPDADDPE
jgi:hypothetical protein